MRLEITRTSELSLRAFRVVATSGRRVPGKELADLIGTSVAFLSHIMPPLVRSGWVGSRPGPDGGYELLVPSESVSVLAVIEAVEGPMDEGRCVLAGGPCGTEPCALHAAWAQAKAALLASFGAVCAVGPTDGSLNER